MDTLSPLVPMHHHDPACAYDFFEITVSPTCISLLQSMINSPQAYEENKAFTKYIVDAMMKALEESWN